MSLLFAVHRTWLALWADYGSRNPSGFSPELMVQSSKWVIETTVQFTLEACRTTPLVPDPHGRGKILDFTC